jgi:hypothetical protein
MNGPFIDRQCLLEALFVRSWDVYLARTTEIARQLEVKNFVTERLREDATSDVAMELEEITINSQKLGDLVQSKVAEGTRKLQAKLAHLEKTIPKKQKGAQTSSGPKELRDSSSRFRRGDVYTKIFFAHMDEHPWDPKQLFFRSKWEPDPAHIPAEFKARVSHFLRELTPKFRSCQVETNLTCPQNQLLRTLKDSDDFIVFPTDKNLGPAILERSEYINRVLMDHLLDFNTYKQLSEANATTKIEALVTSVQSFYDENQTAFTHKDYVFLCRSTEVDDLYPHFYIRAKVNKTPCWKTCPIVSVRGSILLHGLGKWIDQH